MPETLDLSTHDLSTQCFDPRSFDALAGRQTGGCPRRRDARVLIDLLTRFAIEVRLDEHCVTLLEGVGSASRATLVGDDCDLVIAVAGTDTPAGRASDLELRCTPPGRQHGPPGFLADIAPEEVEERLAAILRGDFVERNA